MELELQIGDAVLVYVNGDAAENIQIGSIKYIGCIDGFEMRNNIGIELVEQIDNGHNGRINGYEYFKCTKGHGIYTQITNIIRKLKVSEITSKLQQILTLSKHRLQQYADALSERDEYIEKLKNKQRALRHLINKSQKESNKKPSNIISKKKVSFAAIKEINDGNISFSVPLTPITPSLDASQIKSLSKPNKMRKIKIKKNYDENKCVSTINAETPDTDWSDHNDDSSVDEGNDSMSSSYSIATKDASTITPNSVSTPITKTYQPQQQYAYSQNGYQQHPYNQGNISSNVHHNISDQRVSVLNGNNNYQYQQQQNIMNNNNQQHPQQFVVLYSVPNNNQYNGAMSSNNSYYHY